MYIYLYLCVYVCFFRPPSQPCAIRIAYARNILLFYPMTEREIAVGEETRACR